MDEMEFKEGIFEDPKGAMVRGVKAWSKSSLDKVDRSMAHYFEHKRSPKPATDTMNEGNALHCMVLTPDRYQREIAVAPEVNKRTKAGKEEWADFVDSNANKTVISASSQKDIKLMSEAINNHPVASEVLSNGQPEMSVFWTDKETGLRCKGKVDWLRNDRIIVELKKTTDASYNAFQKKIADFRYNVQAALYLDGVSTIKKVRYLEFLFIVVEDKAPWNVAVYKIGPNSLDAGRSEYISNLNRTIEYETSEECDKWAGYKLGTQTIEMPYWAIQKSLKNKE